MTATNPQSMFGTIQAELEENQRQLEVAIAATRGVEDELSGRTFSGMDRKKMVRVTLARDGMVEDVSVDPRWRTKITPTALGPATLSAYRAARASLVDEVATAFAGAGFGAFSEQVRRHTEAGDEESR
ncbi:hypothetical protein [Actinopolymorpha pittospori]